MPFREQQVTIPTQAGPMLSGTLFEAESPAGQSMVISSATGMLRRFYFAFARHFASLGYHVLTFDYWGIGDSGGQVHELRKNRFDLAHWGFNDQAAAVRYLKARYPQASLTLVTHSIGGQLCGFNPEYAQVDRIIMAASQSGYWGLFRGWHKWKMWNFWYVMIPFLSPPFGYFPAKALGLFENLPLEMARQWSRWGKHPEYMMADREASPHFFDKIRAPLLCLSFPGDPLAPPEAVDWLAKQYPKARTTRVHYTREGKNPGHFGYFRPPFKDTLWAYTHQWITENLWEGQAPGHGPGTR